MNLQIVRYHALNLVLLKIESLNFEMFVTWIIKNIPNNKNCVKTKILGR